MVDTFYVHIEFTTKNGKWSINLPFLCNQCGICCTLDDFLTAGEIKSQPKDVDIRAKMRALYDDLGKIWEEDEDKYDNFIVHTPCPFLTNKTCTIYTIRPDGCRQFPNTPFGMQAKDCESLNRFKKQKVALTKGRKTKQTCHFINLGESALPTIFSDKQYKNSLTKLQQAGITIEELALFEFLNKKK